MDETLLLSGEQLLELKCLYQEEKKMRRKKKRLHSGLAPTKRVKIPKSPVELEKIKKEVDQKLIERFSILGTGRVRLSHDMGSAEWCPQSKSSKITSTKKRSPWMGFMENNQLSYTPEETVFLMEAECILVNYMGAPMSLQAAYQMILADNQLGKLYQMYAYLTRLGFKLKSSQFWNNPNPLVPESNSIVERQNEDDLDRKINPLKSESMPTKSIIDHSRLVMMPLRRGMFLNGTCFDKTATWSEYKRLIEPRENSSVIFDEEATVLELNDELCSSENIFDQLPNKSLIDESNNLKPLIDQTKITDINGLQQILKDTGPRETDLHKLLPPSKSPPLIKYQIFLPTVKNFSNIQPNNLLAYCSDPYTPMVQELMAISSESGQSTPIYGVISHLDFNFITLEPFNLWDETPTFWDSSLRR